MREEEFLVPIDLSGKNGVVFGVANDRSIAWAITQALSDAGARLALTYQGDRLKDRVERLASNLEQPLLLPCDATDDEEIERVFHSLEQEFGEISFLIHSIAFANREDLSGRFVDTGRAGFRVAMEVSAYSLLPLVRHAAPLMNGGGSVVAMTFDASQRVYPGYNVMGSAKAALEHAVRQLAAEMGPSGIRVNAISAGPWKPWLPGASADSATCAMLTLNGRPCNATSPWRKWRRQRCSFAAGCRAALQAQSFPWMRDTT